MFFKQDFWGFHGLRSFSKYSLWLQKIQLRLVLKNPKRHVVIVISKLVQILDTMSSSSLGMSRFRTPARLWSNTKVLNNKNGILKGQLFKSQHSQTCLLDRLLYNQIPIDLYKIELTKLIQAYGDLLSTVTLHLGHPTEHTLG